VCLVLNGMEYGGAGKYTGRIIKNGWVYKILMKYSDGSFATPFCAFQIRNKKNIPMRNGHFVSAFRNKQDALNDLKNLREDNYSHKSWKLFKFRAKNIAKGTHHNYSYWEREIKSAVGCTEILIPADFEENPEKYIVKE